MPSYTKSKLGLSIPKADLRRDLEGYSQEIERTAPVVNTQQDWYVNSTTGDDVVGNGTEEAPLRSLVTLASKINTKSEVPINVWLDGDFSSEDLRLEPEFLNLGEYLSVYGTATQVGSGTLTGVTAWTTNVDANILEDTSQDFSGFVKDRIRFTSGAAIGAIGWIVRANPLSGGTDTCRVSGIALVDEFTAGNLGAYSAKTPSIGDDYVIEELTQVGRGSFNVIAQNTGFETRTTILANLDFTFSSFLIPTLRLGPQYSATLCILLKSRVSGDILEGPFINNPFLVGLQLGASLLAPSSSGSLIGGVTGYYFAYIGSNRMTCSRLLLQDDCLFQGAGVNVTADLSTINIDDETMVADADYGVGLTGSLGCTLHIYGGFWGVSIATELVRVGSGNLCGIRSGHTPTVPNTVKVAGNAQTDWATALAAGLDTVYGAGVVAREP